MVLSDTLCGRSFVFDHVDVHQRGEEGLFAAGASIAKCLLCATRSLLAFIYNSGRPDLITLEFYSGAVSFCDTV